MNIFGIILVGLLGLLASCDQNGPQNAGPGGSLADQAQPARNQAQIRFVAIGDQGTGSDTQRQVGAAIGKVCQDLGGCDFGLLLGDNIYESGVSGVDDTRWTSHFEVPYGALKFPFYAVLGNHDLGIPAWVDLDEDKAGYQISYGQKNPQWKMPARFYDFSAGPVHFVALDTNPILFGRDSDQRRAVAGMLSAPDSRWKVAFGHHPYYSNGTHGNAGNYDDRAFMPFFNGQNFRSFMDDEICGKVDFYICGHDHSRQDLVPDCQGTQFLVSGAGAKTTRLPGQNLVYFQSDSVGFLLIEAGESSFRIRFYDEDGALDHERLVSR